jgi:HAD superfamily hydrolase (TIGR01490 family)
VVAFLDIDGTILGINSGVAWARHLRSTGRLGFLGILRTARWLVEYRLGRLDYEAMAERELSDWIGADADALAAEVAGWYRREVRGAVRPAARHAIERHRARGDVVALLTSGTRWLAEPLAADLGLADVICTEVEVAAGRLTGRIVAPACYGPGKVARARTFLEARHAVAAEAWCYADSRTDIPVLSFVGHPVAVTPDAGLLREARRRGWPVESWGAP